MAFRLGSAIAATLQNSIKTLLCDILPLYENCRARDLDIALSHVVILIIS